MKIKSLKWDYEGDSIACDPVSGSHVLELSLADGESAVYLTVDYFEGCGTIYISRVPLYDVLMSASENGNYDEKVERFKSNLIGVAELDENDSLFVDADPDDAYSAETNAVVQCLHAYFNRDVTDFAEEFIRDFVGKDLSECYVDLYVAANHVDERKTEMISEMETIADQMFDCVKNHFEEVGREITIDVYDAGYSVLEPGNKLFFYLCSFEDGEHKNQVMGKLQHEMLRDLEPLADQLFSVVQNYRECNMPVVYKVRILNRFRLSIEDVSCSRILSCKFYKNEELIRFPS